MKLSKSTIRIFGLCAFYLLYMFIGAAIFSSIEYPNEKEIIDKLKARRHEFLKKHKSCLNDSELETFITKIVGANNRGISTIANLTVEPNWSFGQAVFFAGTVLTTIGYGHVSPLSTGGKVFCIFYAIIGIPITLILISACVERLLIITNNLYDKLKTLSIFYRHNSSINLKALTYTHLAIVFTFVVTFFFLIPAAIFSSIEQEWNYLDALYYCFISLTTIGLGDYIPGDKNEQPYRVFYKIATTFYLILGIMFVMLFITVLTQIPELNLAKLLSLEIETSNDPERQLLTSDTCPASSTYNRQIDEDDTISVNQIPNTSKY